jgi:hypothetical protein
LPTLCAIVEQPLPSRPLDGMDLADVIDDKISSRPTPLYFWEYNSQRLADSNPTPWLDPELQKGTTPLVKLMAGKATRDFTNFRHPTIAEDDYLARSRSFGRSMHFDACMRFGTQL